MTAEMKIKSLRNEISKLLSPKRFSHTLGVERAALELGKLYIPTEQLYELSAAALLHDVAKELHKEELISVMKRSGEPFTDEDYLSEPLYHAFAAPTVIKERFPEFATEKILSAVFLHTSGSDNMSVFDKIIFLADFIEDGRKYSACVEIRERFESAINATASQSERLRILDFYVYTVLDFTVKYLQKEGKAVNSRTLMAKAALASKI